jgi:hypothetical protein
MSGRRQTAKLAVDCPLDGRVRAPGVHGELPLPGVRCPSMRAGRNSTARSNANSASKVMPTRRNGNERTHTRGHNTRTNKARGQHRTNKTHQMTRERRVLIGGCPRHGVGTDESVPLFRAELAARWPRVRRTACLSAGAELWGAAEQFAGRVDGRPGRAVN